jgi:hypothetical protein
MNVPLQVALVVIGVVLFAVAIAGFVDSVQFKITHLPIWARVVFGIAGVIIFGLAFTPLAKSTSNSSSNSSSQALASSSVNPSGRSSTTSSSTVKPIYRETWVRVAQKSLYLVKHPGEELSSKFLLRNNIGIDWNGEGNVYLSGDSNGPAPVWVDDILDITIVNPDGQEQPYYKDFSNDCTKGGNSGGAGIDLTKYLEPGTNAIQITIRDNANCAGKNAMVGSSDIFLRGIFRNLS